MEGATVDFSEVDKLIRDIKNGVADCSVPLEDTGAEIIEFVGSKNFDEQGRALNAPWAPHSVWTLQARARRYGHYSNPPIETSKILVWTGALKAGFVKTVERTVLTIENSVEYFQYLISKRKMLGITQDIVDIVEKNFTKYIQGLIK